MVALKRTCLSASNWSMSVFSMAGVSMSSLMTTKSSGSARARSKFHGLYLLSGSADTPTL